ncbi:hypothetical protein H2684_05970 [Clostridium sp. cel8]|jgi:uncharacterized protein YneF (UPF0154 family)|uniref:hypothetical protein n=1 Tax=Clostridium sp. cel8 TaxID=2663123 RepID=UPI0015F56547|nr:hypothetical protein [Clostridium sp. cel8]MBA5850867.1 hypothetical protein [Clostridium sp. cel8]
MLLAIEILAIITMCTIVFILIWGFIIAKQTLSQIKYKNYLLEQIKEHLHSIAKKDITTLENVMDSYNEKE